MNAASLSLSWVTAGPERRQIGPVLVVFIINRTVRQGSDQDAVPAPRHLAAPAKHAGVFISTCHHQSSPAEQVLSAMQHN